MELTSSEDICRLGADEPAVAPAAAAHEPRRARLAAVRRRVSSVMRRWANKRGSGGAIADAIEGPVGGGSGGDITGAAGHGDDPDSRLIHDLRTPLTSIRSFSEILRQHPELSYRQRARYLDIILSEGRRLERAIEAVEARSGPDPAR